MLGYSVLGVGHATVADFDIVAIEYLVQTASFWKMLIK